jgi:hypothetical protein
MVPPCGVVHTMIVSWLDRIIVANVGFESNWVAGEITWRLKSQLKVHQVQPSLDWLVQGLLEVPLAERWLTIYPKVGAPVELVKTRFWFR